MRNFEQYFSQMEEAEHTLKESQKRQIFLKGVEDRDYLVTKDLCTTKIHQLRKNSVQLNKDRQTISKQYCRANHMCRNGGCPINRNNQNTGNDKEKKHNAPYIPE